MVVETILKKRDGHELSETEIEGFIRGFVQGEIKDYQMSAFLMAIYFRGLNKKETHALTHSMWKSGKTFTRLHRNDYWIDKHSTGGVGDKTSLILVPLVISTTKRLVASGVRLPKPPFASIPPVRIPQAKIPMIAGRGLGFSGGTLDKLESVRGLSGKLSEKQATELLERNGFFLISQTRDLAPADGLIYALRDVTGTIESIPLIVASIMSKKFCENLDGIVFDVKTGSGAFMQTMAQANELAEQLVETAKTHKMDAVALITNMTEPLGFKVGNQLEVEECADFLDQSCQDMGLKLVVVELATRMLHFASRRTISLDNAKEEIETELQSKRPYELFQTMIKAQGGDWDFFEANRRMLRAELPCYVHQANIDGFVANIDARAIGQLLTQLGGGRQRKEDAIDFEVGFEFEKKVGDPVKKNDTIVKVYYRALLSTIKTILNEAIQVGSEQEKSKWLLACHE